MSIKTTLAVGALLLSGGACAVPKVMVGHEIIHSRSVHTVFQKTSTGGSDSSENLYDYALTVCDFDSSGRETSCRETVILRNVSYAVNTREANR